MSKSKKEFLVKLLISTAIVGAARYFDITIEDVDLAPIVEKVTLFVFGWLALSKPADAKALKAAAQ